MNEVPQKPDELLWKTAITAASFDGKYEKENKFHFNVEELGVILQRVKDVLPNSTDWNTYFTPQIVWLSVESSYFHMEKDHIFPDKEAYLQLVSNVVEKLREVFSND
ncbi:hypothetical protein [Acetobacter malorum]|uniref:hypothetical protein n=1 Tax=Acetobacter malorum TaxID=178901 RepID=UPI0039EC9D1D